ncbi:hypothetical protein NOR53_48 [gamma proteobacterium NOR5-3]|nr:hypothetical protein NOR53_48 [gamma proteobacterium NOR5-3]
MDQFARNYLIGLIAVILFGGAWYWLSQDGRVSEINDRLASDSERWYNERGVLLDLGN